MPAQSEPPAADIGRAFMERTHYQYLEVSDQRRGFPPPPLQLEMAPQSLCCGSLLSVSTWQDASVPMMSPMSANNGPWLESHIVSSAGGA